MIYNKIWTNWTVTIMKQEWERVDGEAEKTEIFWKYQFLDAGLTVTETSLVLQNKSRISALHFKLIKLSCWFKCCSSIVKLRVRET